MSQRTRARTTGAAARPINRNRANSADAENVNSAESVEMEQRERQAKPADAPKRGKRAAADAPLADQTPSAPTGAPAGLPLQPDALARALRAVATELERDPALAERVAQAINEAPAASASDPPRADHAASAPAPEPDAPTIGRTFHPRIVTGVADSLGPGVPDPFALRERLGEPGLREALESLRLGSLRAIVRQHKLDPSGSLSKLNDAEKLRAHILKATRKAGK